MFSGVICWRKTIIVKEIPCMFAGGRANLECEEWAVCCVVAVDGV